MPSKNSPPKPASSPTDVATTAPAPGFDTLGLDDRLLQALAALGYEEPTSIPPIRLLGRPHWPGVM